MSSLVSPSLVDWASFTSPQRWALTGLAQGDRGAALRRASGRTAASLERRGLIERRPARPGVVPGWRLTAEGQCTVIGRGWVADLLVRSDDVVEDTPTAHTVAAPEPDAPAPSTELAMPRVFPWLPVELEPTASLSNQTKCDQLQANLRTIRDEIGAARARYVAFARWVEDEAQRELRRIEREDGPDAPCSPRLQALIDVIERLPEGRVAPASTDDATSTSV